MIDKKLREDIILLNENAVLFDNPSFDNSIIGLSTEGNVVYDLNFMIEELAIEENLTYEEAADFIDYNTIRTIPYIVEGNKPIICSSLN